MVSSRDSLVILLHGVGANGRDLAQLAGGLRSYLPQTHFAAPDAPGRFDEGPGRQWFSMAGVSQANRPQRVEAARADFDQIVSAELAHVGLADQLDRVALVGFSQGAIMALDAIASGRWPVAAVVAFSGRLASPAPLAPPSGARALLVHGEADTVIPSDETLAAAATLRQAGVQVEARIYPGLGHAISPEGIALAGAFLSDRLGD
jgi:phospholipase/carboxylesterase